MEDTNPEQVCVLTKTEGSAKVTDREETETPEVFTATWMPDDHISELTCILQGGFREGSFIVNCYYFTSNAVANALATAATVPDGSQTKAYTTYIQAMYSLQIFIAIYNSCIFGMNYRERFREIWGNGHSHLIEHKKL